MVAISVHLKSWCTQSLPSCSGTTVRLFVRWGHEAKAIVPIASTAALLAACGEDPEGGSPNRGAGSETALISIENAYIVPANVVGFCALQVGDAASLRYVVSNGSNTTAATFTGVRTDVASSVQVAPPGPKYVPASGTITSAEPDTRGPSHFTTTLVGLKETVEPGKSFDITFTFDNFDPVKLQVAVESCPADGSAPG